jgi:CubicO group peptidase (beta-lactamase class C family)
MTQLTDLLTRHVTETSLPGAVALVAAGDDVRVATVGVADLDTATPLARDSIFRIASITKPITAAAVLMLVEDRRIAMTDPIAKWLPELADPVVVRTPDSPIDDVVPARRPITVADLLTSCAGWGFPMDVTLPAVQALFTVQKDGRDPNNFPTPDEWLAQLARVPLLHQPGEKWLYNTCSDVQGVLVERVTGELLGDVLAARLFEPLGMVDSGFVVPAAHRHRLTTFYRETDEGLVAADGPDGAWATPPRFRSGAGGLAGTADDWLAFGRFLLDGGRTADGRQLLSAESVRLMTTDRLTPAQRAGTGLVGEGQSWGYGGAVDLDSARPWSVPGRYGWVGGTGTAAHVVPATRTVAVLLTQYAMASPAFTPLQQEFWTTVNLISRDSR